MPLGRGLSSLIPDREPDDRNSDGFSPTADDQNTSHQASGHQPNIQDTKSDPVDPGKSEYPAGMRNTQNDFRAAPISESTPPSAKTYEDHFAQRRGDSIFWIEIDKVDANPFQPRREFADEALKDLSESIRAHGVLQPILVTKLELETPGGLEVRYQLIAGE